MKFFVLAIIASLAVISAVHAVPLRGAFDIPMDQQQQQQQQQAPQQGDLISFLQGHQRAYQSQAAGHAERAPSQQAQAAAAETTPAGATEASGDNVLAALEHTPSNHHMNNKAVHSLSNGAQHSLVQTTSKAVTTKAGEDGDGEDFGSCKTCVFVLERIKKGSNMLLPAICSELYHKYPDAYALCHQVLNALSINGNNVRYWLFEGCFKYEIYQSKEWIKPCPSHVMCSVLKDLSAEPFCPALPMENPFEAAAGGE